MNIRTNKRKCGETTTFFVAVQRIKSKNDYLRVDYLGSCAVPSLRTQVAEAFSDHVDDGSIYWVKSSKAQNVTTPAQAIEFVKNNCNENL